MSKTLNSLLDLAKSQTGYTEKDNDKNLDAMVGSTAGSGNHTKYARDLTAMGLPSYCGSAWCAVYQMWLEVQIVGKEQALKNMGQQFYNCFATREYAKSKGRWLPAGKTPKVGDLVVFTQSHIARVTDVKGGKIYTNEGNTNNGTAVVRNGGMVCNKAYDLTNTSISGYVQMDYKDAQLPAGWQTDNIGTWYRHDDGSYTQNDWEQIDGKWYWFDGAGYAVHNAWSQGKDGRWYYMGEDCSMVANAVLQIGGEVFAFGADGAMITDSGKLKISGRGAISLISRTL